MNIGFHKDEYYYEDSDTCDQSSSSEKCLKNKTGAQSLEKIKTDLSAAEQRVIDVNVYTNRELQLTVNLLVGLGGLMYYLSKMDYRVISTG